MNDDCDGELVVVAETVASCSQETDSKQIESNERDVVAMRSGVDVDASAIGSGEVFDLIRAMAEPFMEADQSERGVDAMLRARAVGAAAAAPAGAAPRPDAEVSQATARRWQRRWPRT